MLQFIESYSLSDNAWHNLQFSIEDDMGTRGWKYQPLLPKWQQRMSQLGTLLCTRTIL
jgi:hypothetical protein